MKKNALRGQCHIPITKSSSFLDEAAFLGTMMFKEKSWNHE